MSLWESLLFWSAGAISFISGVLALRANQGRIPRLLFLLIALSSGLCFWCFPAFAESTLDVRIEYFFFWAVTLTPFLWLVFSLTFACENYRTYIRRWKVWFWIVGALSVFFAVMSTITPLMIIQIGVSDRPELILNPYGKWFIVLLLLICSFVLINFESTYRAATGIYRRRLRLSVMTTAIFFATIIVALSSGMLKTSLSIRYVEFATAVAIVMYPSVGYYLRTYQLQKSGVFIKRQAVYSSVGIILIGIYLILVGAVGKAVQLIGADSKVFYSILAAFLVIVVFLSLLLSSSLKKRIRSFVDRSFYSGSAADYQEDLALFSEDISTTLNVSDLAERLSTLLREKLGVSRLWLYLEHSQLPVFTRVYPAIERVSGQIERNSGFVDWMFRHGEAIEFDDLIARLSSAGVPVPDEGLPASAEISVCMPLIAKRRIVGLLLVGSRKSDDNFSHQDMQLISAVGNQFALAVLSARLSQELLAARQIESFHKFSTFVVHDLKNSISMLSMLLQNYESKADNPEFQKSVLVTIQGAVARMQSVISKLRGSEMIESQTISNCNPVDIVVSLRDKLGLESLSGIRYRENFDSTSPIKADVEKLTGVIENLVVNAIEAMPQGGDLTISVFNGLETLTIEVKDTGKGMDAEFINKRLFSPFETTKKKGLGIGLYLSRDQLERMGGTFHVESEPGERTTFQIVFPR
ncbi:MAG: PEP-CTERM system histidine kinase PrsK [candidate division Zixibacteria bacterium]|nr:PEP-CTERM system histidine kinase PrsK [candidate division Zixibacteria bacterium]